MSIKPISDVENMPPEAIELFEAAGYLDAQAILAKKISDITIELVKANNVLEIIDVNPTIEMVKQWLEPLEAKYGTTYEDDSLLVDPSMMIELDEIINSPHSLPISKQFLHKNNINLSDIPSGNLLFTDRDQALKYLIKSENEALTPTKTISTLPDKKSENIKPLLFDKPSLSKKEPQPLDLSRIISIETFQNEGSHVLPITGSEDVNHIKSVSKETNKGVNPKSRFYIKGVLHKEASKFKSGCRWFILINLLVFLSFVITPLVLLDKEKFFWAVWAPLLGVISILLYFVVAHCSKCPVCNQKQFAPKICRKHKNAHHWAVFGYMLPTAIHALLFKWFRCIYCGTSVRLKK
jgi:hypothetical protein